MSFKQVSEIVIVPETSSIRRRLRSWRAFSAKSGQLGLAGFDSTPTLRSQVIASEQQAIPAVEYLMGKEGGGAKRFFLLGTDYVYPRTTSAGT